jgi:lipopolysaccharide export system protein LptA
MKTYPILLWVMLGFFCTAMGQEWQTRSILKIIDPPNFGPALVAYANPSPKPKDSQSARTQADTTTIEITASRGTAFNKFTRTAIFMGKVCVKHPQFSLTADKVTVIYKKENAGHYTKVINPASMPKAAGHTGDNSWLEKAIAEGGVVITQDKPSTNDGKMVHYIGKATHVVYDSATGDLTLTGWPQVEQGVNIQIATRETTVMVLNSDGRMSTTGACRTLIQSARKPETRENQTF